jgi:hypothetical protein
MEDYNNKIADIKLYKSESTILDSQSDTYINPDEPIANY